MSQPGFMETGRKGLPKTSLIDWQYFADIESIELLAREHSADEGTDQQLLFAFAYFAVQEFQHLAVV